MVCSTQNCNIWGQEQTLRLRSDEKLILELIPGQFCIVQDCGICLDSKDPSLKVYVDGNELAIGQEYKKCGRIELTFEGSGRARLLEWAWCGYGHPVWCKWLNLEVVQPPQQQPPQQPQPPQPPPPTPPTPPTPPPQQPSNSLGEIPIIALGIIVGGSIGYLLWKKWRGRK